MKFSRASFAFIACLWLAGCSFSEGILSSYKIDIQQGNVLTQEMVANLRPGLTRDQVRFALGTPLLMDMYHANRWDYVYRLQQGSGALETRNFSVFFDATGKLTRVTGDVAALGAEDRQAPQKAALQTFDLGAIDPESGALPPENEEGFFSKLWDTVF